MSSLILRSQTIDNQVIDVCEDLIQLSSYIEKSIEKKKNQSIALYFNRCIFFSGKFSIFQQGQFGAF